MTPETLACPGGGFVKSGAGEPVFRFVAAFARLAQSETFLLSPSPDAIRSPARLFVHISSLTRGDVELSGAGVALVEVDSGKGKLRWLFPSKIAKS
jgi:hypothetical protein